jgi:hypothetical protein
MMIYTPKTMGLVHEALTRLENNVSRVRINDDATLQGVPLPELPGVSTVGDLRKLSKWPPNLRLIVNAYAPDGPVVRVEQRWSA